MRARCAACGNGGPRDIRRDNFREGMNSQLPRIIAILERDGQIDNFQCIHNRLTLRLGARIFDLRQRGWEFRTEMKKDTNTVYVVTMVPELTLFTQKRKRVKHWKRNSALRKEGGLPHQNKVALATCRPTGQYNVVPSVVVKLRCRIITFEGANIIH
jgi:hypothetical protein